MNHKGMSPAAKQFTVLPNETAPEQAMAKAHQAVSKALTEIKSGRKKDLADSKSRKSG